MSVDIEKVEKYILLGFDSGKSPPIKKLSFKNNLLAIGFLCCLLSWGVFIMAYRELPNIENIYIYHFYGVLALIPVAAVLSIIICKKIINKADYEDKPIYKIFIALLPVIVFIPLSIFLFTAQQDAIATVSFFVFAVGGLICVLVACGFFYKVYLIRKYAPYFKDWRIRRPAK